MTLSKNEIHVHILSTEKFYKKSGIDFFLPKLSEEEKKRAFSFKFKKHQEAFIFSRGMLREKLSSYTGIKPEDIVFNYRNAGKPELAGKNELNIKFNVSHSEDLTAFAFARQNELGIDVQHMRDLTDLEGMIQYNLSYSEQKSISEYKGNIRKILFYRFWTHKEAYIKATGEGLAYNLSNVEFSFKNNRFELHRMLNMEIIPENWSVFELQLENNNEYSGALIVDNSMENREWIVKYCFNGIE